MWDASPRLLFVLVVFLTLILVPLITFTRGTVSRERLERFAERQRLPITVDNGNQVIRYLATTRRWRVAGFVAGIVASQLVAPPDAIIHLNFAALFAGWFLGALIAEARVAHLAHRPVRSASLEPRRPQRYVPLWVWRLVPTAGAGALAVAVLTAVSGAVGWARPHVGWATTWAVLAGVVVVAVRVVQNLVLHRAQPLAEPDVLAADDAVRSRSLHVLSGGGMALLGILIVNQLQALQPTGLVARQIVGLVGILGPFAAAVAGWLVATSVRSGQRVGVDDHRG